MTDAMIDLRDLVESDGDRLFAWRRQAEVNRWMSDQPPRALEEHQAGFQAFLADSDRRGWIINRNGQAVGFLSLTGLTNCNRRAEWGWYIADADARGRGVGRAAEALGLDKAFDDLGLEKVSAEVFADNEAALKAQAAAGFRREGYLRRHALKDGQFRDVVLLAILAEEWRGCRARVRKNLVGSHLIAA
jgi:UDP-4-amino-4,6-dideoxy-N-acetyl-beta-L-altrosamine N-acetyltransferase